MEFNISDIVKTLSSDEILRNISSTAILIVVLFAGRIAAMRSINKFKSTYESKLEWKSHVRTLTNIVLVLGIFIVWGSELRTLAISLVAIAVAIVIATKELILCLLGGILKSFTRPFKIGDRVEIDRFRGDVIEHNFLTTTLFEIGPARSSHLHTGRRVTIPNSIFLSHGIVNETKRYKFGLHTFTVSLPHTVNVGFHQKTLLDAATDICGGYTEEAQQYLNLIGASGGIEPPNADPKVLISFNSGTSLDLIVRIPIPALKSARIEQAILQLYVEKRETTTT